MKLFILLVNVLFGISVFAQEVNIPVSAAEKYFVTSTTIYRDSVLNDGITHGIQGLWVTLYAVKYNLEKKRLD